MDKMLQVQNPHTQQFESVYVCGLPDYPKPQPAPVINLPARSNSHPLLIGGIVIGLFLGIIACLPPALRGWVVLAIIAGIGWFLWSTIHDAATAEVYAGTQTPVPAQHYSDYAPRAELVRLPRK